MSPKAADSGAFLSLSHAFGAVGGVRDNVVHVSENTIAYPVGRHIGVYNMDSHDMSFIQESETVKKIVAMCISPNKKYLAVAECVSDGTGQVTVFNVPSEKKMRTLSHVEIIREIGR